MNSVYNGVSSIDDHANHTPSGKGENRVETHFTILLTNGHVQFLLRGEHKQVL